MTSGPAGTSYRELSKLADTLFKASGDNEEELASHLDRVEPVVRGELLVSDLLNAYQVFYYYFREVPDELEKERMLLAPASLLNHGVIIREIDYLTVIFRVDMEGPVLAVYDDEQVLANFRGTGAYQDVKRFIDDSL